MSEVEKMYKNAGVKNKYCCKSSQCIVTNPHSEWCNKCESLIIKYPDFTAEKQLELIKWLGKFDYMIRIVFYEKEWGIATEYHDGSFQNNLSDALASIINDIWPDLTEEERKQIAEILRG